MAYFDAIAHQLVGIVRLHRGWMVWNLILAVVPALLALVLFARPRRRSLAWWVGVVTFVLFLPNAPYVVTDLIHLRWSITSTTSDGAVVAGVLPLYALFVTAGFVAYLVCTELVVREVRRARPATGRLTVEIALHAVSALGIVLGRIARLNSWDTIAAPTGTLERIFATLSWRGAPVAFVAVFVAVWITHALVRTVAFSMGGVARLGLQRLAPAA